MKFPLVFAHRGANSFAPENSLAAFRKAIELGCDGIELDVRYTADGNVVVFHDRHTFRMTGVRGNIHRMSARQIGQLRLLQNSFPPEKIPTLAEVLDMVGRNIRVIIDVKKESLTGNGLEEKIVTIISDMGMDENVIISSFNPFVIKKMSVLNPRLHLGFIFRNRSSMMMLNGEPVRSLHARFRILSQRYLRNLRQRAAQVFAWTVDDEPVMFDLIEKGVDGIITNRPERFMRLKQNLLFWQTMQTPDCVFC